MRGPLQVLVIAFPEPRFDGSRQASRVAAAQPQPRTAAPPTTSPPDRAAGDDLLAQLNQLAELKAAGVLDDREFAAAKAKLLG